MHLLNYYKIEINLKIRGGKWMSSYQYFKNLIRANYIRPVKLAP